MVTYKAGSSVEEVRPRLGQVEQGSFIRHSSVYSNLLLSFYPFTYVQSEQDVQSELL